MFIEAHEAYQNQVVKGGKLIRRYTEDFVNSHYYTDETTASGKNRHRRDYHILKSILENRPDLVEKYLDKPGFDVSDFHAMMHEFDTVEQGTATSIPAEALSVPRKVPTITFGGNFNDEQIAVLTEAANNYSIFASEISHDEMKGLLEANLSTPLTAYNNRCVAVFFDALAENTLINRNWQKVIADNKLILSSTLMKPIQCRYLSSALSASKREKEAVFKSIRKIVEDIVRLQ